MLQQVTTEQYKGIDKTGPYILEFYSNTCGPCKMLSYVLKDIDKNDPDFRIYQAEFNENADLKEELGVTGFPTILLMKDGKEMSRIEGLKQKPFIVEEIAKLKAM